MNSVPDFNGVDRVLWDPKEQNQQIIAIDSNQLYLTSIHDGACQVSRAINLRFLLADMGTLRPH